jgi:hypothetical protein
MGEAPRRRPMAGAFWRESRAASVQRLGVTARAERVHDLRAIGCFRLSPQSRPSGRCALLRIEGRGDEAMERTRCYCWRTSDVNGASTLRALQPPQSTPGKSRQLAHVIREARIRAVPSVCAKTREAMCNSAVYQKSVTLPASGQRVHDD